MQNVDMMYEAAVAQEWEMLNKPALDEDVVDEILKHLEESMKRLSDAEDELVEIVDIVDGDPLEDRINSIRDGVNDMWSAVYRLRENVRKGVA